MADNGFPLPEVIVDRLISPLMLELRDCLCHELARTPAGPVCRCYLDHVPNPPIMDGCTCECVVQGRPGNGDGWVRLVKTDPETGEGSLTPVRSLGRAGCPLGWIALLEIGSYRCLPLPDDGSPPLAETLTATALMLAADRAALERTLACCPVLADTGATISSGFLPMRQGGCGGGTIQVSVPFAVGDPCAEQPVPQWSTSE